MADTNERTRIGGYISVRTVLEAGTREVYGLLLDKNRLDKVRASAYHLPEKRQYEALERITASRGIPVETIAEDAFAARGGCESDGGIAAYVGDRSFAAEGEALESPVPFTVLLDGIEDPYNFGYILRTLYAAGVDWVVLPRRNFFTASETVIRASAGASELLRIAVTDDPAAFCRRAADAGRFIVSTAKSGEAKNLFSVRLKPPVCLVIGGEKRGISKGILEASHVTVKIKYARNCAFSLPAVSAASVIAFKYAFGAAGRHAERHRFYGDGPAAPRKPFGAGQIAPRYAEFGAVVFAQEIVHAQKHLGFEHVQFERVNGDRAELSVVRIAQSAEIAVGGAAFFQIRQYGLFDEHRDFIRSAPVCRPISLPPMILYRPPAAVHTLCGRPPAYYILRRVGLRPALMLVGQRR